jgi:hypothetical protein
MKKQTSSAHSKAYSSTQESTLICCFAAVSAVCSLFLLSVVGVGSVHGFAVGFSKIRFMKFNIQHIVQTKADQIGHATL